MARDLAALMHELGLDFAARAAEAWRSGPKQSARPEIASLRSQ